MKKILVISTLISAALAIIVLVVSAILSFTVVKPTTDQINRKLARKFTKVVNIPEVMPPQTRNFYETIYIWEMETNQQEVVGVRFRHATGFDGKSKEQEATLELPEPGDPSIFNKVLPAVIADDQSLLGALDPKKASFEPNSVAGYKTYKLAVKPETNQTVSITWIFDNDYITEDARNEYQKLAKFPLPVLKFLYLFQKTIFELMAS